MKMSLDSLSSPRAASLGLCRALAVAENSSLIRRDHSLRPLGSNEGGHIWRHGALNGAEMFHGSYRKYEFARHFHSVPAIGVVGKGSMSCYCRGETNVLPPGTVLLFNPGEVHAPGPAGSGEWSFRIFFFEEEMFRERSTDVTRTPLRFTKPFVEDRHLSESLLRLHRKLEAEGTALELESSLLEIFSELARKHVYVPASIQQTGMEKSRIKRVRDYLHANYEREVTLDDLAGLVRSSPYHLLRTFRESVGLTPHAYLIQIRVEEGKRLLRAGNPISDVSFSAGFTDQSHFTRHFKRIMGVTPGQYLA
jgi:AraC-like DNA-binding protein